MKKYIISGPGPDGIEDIYICTLDKGCNLKSLRDALKHHYTARVAKPGEGSELRSKHYSIATLLFG
jgi:hypothetical protein